MTLNAKIGVFMDFLAILGCETFQERIAPKPIEIDTEKLRTKFSALNMNIDFSSLDFLGSRKLVHEGIKEWYPRKSRYFTIVGQFFVKTVADRHGHGVCYLSQQAPVTSFSVISTLMTLKDPKLPKQGGFIDFCYLQLQRTLQE